MSRIMCTIYYWLWIVVVYPSGSTGVDPREFTIWRDYRSLKSEELTTAWLKYILIVSETN